MSRERNVLRLAIGACILFVVAFLVQGFLREGYSFLKYPVSSLSIGENGWIQKLNFIFCGSAIMFSTSSLLTINPAKEYRAIAVAVGLAGLGLLGAGLFNSDPVYGYPRDARLALSQFTLTGHLHDLLSILFFFGLPFAFLRMHKLQKNEKVWKKPPLFGVATLIMTLCFFLATIGFKQVRPFFVVAGLLQRLSITTGIAGLCIVYCNYILRSLKTDLWHQQY